MNSLFNLTMEEARKTIYESPSLRLIAMDLEVNFTLSDPTITSPYENELDWD